MLANPENQLWHLDAACRGPYQAIFFPPERTERRKEKRMREARAKEICLECPVLEQCRGYAFDIREQHGIWGGLTENERKELFALGDQMGATLTSV